MSKEIQEAMKKRIGKRDYNFMLESQAAELESNDKIIIMHSKQDKGINNVDLILEPDKFDELSSKIRLTFDEYCEVINTLIEEEEAEWSELRMKDQINITRDNIIQATMLKYAEEEYEIKKENYQGLDINYTKRYDHKGRFIGEAVILTMTSIPMMGVYTK